MRPVRSSSLLLACALVVSLAGLTGCGSDTAASSTPASTSSETSEESTPTRKAIDKDAICAAITDDQIAAVLGGPVTRKIYPDGCQFDQQDPQAPMVTFLVTEPLDGHAGFELAKTAISSENTDLEGRELTDVGDEAYVAIGTRVADPVRAAAGVVLAEGLMIAVDMFHIDDLTTDQTTEMVTRILTLAAAAA